MTANRLRLFARANVHYVLYVLLWHQWWWWINMLFLLPIKLPICDFIGHNSRDEENEVYAVFSFGMQKFSLWGGNVAVFIFQFIRKQVAVIFSQNNQASCWMRIIDAKMSLWINAECSIALLMMIEGGFQRRKNTFHKLSIALTETNEYSYCATRREIYSTQSNELPHEGVCI